MILCRTPFRISFAGGGSDLAAFYTKREGAVLSASINKYMYVFIHPTFSAEDTIAKYSKTEIVKSISDIQHPLVRQCLIDEGIKGIELTSISDVPSGTGLASSSAFSVSIIHALSKYKGRKIEQEDLARLACELEINKCGGKLGKQDQYGVAIGGIKFIRFLCNGQVVVERIVLPEVIINELESNCVLYYTGMTHNAQELLQTQMKRTEENKRTFDNLGLMVSLASRMRTALINNDLDNFGKMLHEGWILKRELSPGITNVFIDQIYDLAIENGALGGKLLGAGGGGFMLFYCRKPDQMKLKKALSKKMREVSFKFDFEGSTILLDE